MSPSKITVSPALAGTTEDDALSALRQPGTVELVENLRRWSTTTPIRLAAACTGTFPLAEAGVLDGLNATTSWWLAPLFRRRYPNVVLNMNSTVVYADNVTTSGAAFAHIDLALALLGSLSPELSSMVSRYLVIDHRPSQSTYAILGHLAAADPIVQTFEPHVRDNVASIQDITDVAATIGTNRRTLERHIKDTLGISPKEFIRQLRVERATHLLRASTLNTDHIAHEVGYATAASLRAAIRKHNTCAPKTGPVLRLKPAVGGRCRVPGYKELTVVVLRSYHRRVSGVVKRSVSLPSEVFAALEREAAAQGQTVSAALADAADQWLATRRGLRAVRAWERENGELTADELAAADVDLDRAGVARR